MIGTRRVDDVFVVVMVIGGIMYKYGPGKEEEEKYMLEPSLVLWIKEMGKTDGGLRLWSRRSFKMCLNNLAL